MKKNKKIIILVLSLVLVLSITATIFIVTANAKQTDIAITVDKTELSVGQTATVSVSVKANYPIATMSIPVFYDKTLVDVSDVTATISDYAVKSVITDEQSADPSKVYANTGVDSEKFGFVLVTYIGGAGKTVPETTDGVVLTFRITAKAGASGTEVIKCVSQSTKTDGNVAGMLYFGATVNENVIDAVPENVKNINLEKAEANLVVSPSGTALVPNKEYTGVVDSVRNYVYGVPAGVTTEDFKEFFSVINGSFDIIANEAGYTNGTGATLVVKDENGNEITTYTLIIFGDVNGDGTVTATDANIIANATVGGTIDGDAYNYAADTNGDAAVTATDANIVTNTTVGGEITVNPYEK